MEPINKNEYDIYELNDEEENIYNEAPSGGKLKKNKNDNNNKEKEHIYSEAPSGGKLKEKDILLMNEIENVNENNENNENNERKSSNSSSTKTKRKSRRLSSSVKK